MAVPASHILHSSTGLARLMALAAQASATIPYYQQAFAAVDFSGTDLHPSALPLLTKEQVREAQDAMVRPDYLQKQPDVLVAYTSGSTGIPLRLIRRHSEMLHAARALWKARMAIFPDLLHSNGATITNRIDSDVSARQVTVQQKGKRRELAEIILLGSEHITIYLDELDYHRPTWLAGPPALLMLLAEGIRKHNRPLKTKLAFIESRGTVLTQETRDVLAETFQCLVVDHYGCEETQTIAYECPKGQLHLLDECAVVELHAQAGAQEYEIIVSTLIFETMPFLRYCTGDLIHVQQRSCSCGNSSAVLGQVRGRINDAIAGTALNGPYTLHLVIQQVIINLGMNPIQQYQVHQVGIHEFEVNFILDDPELLNAVAQEFQRVIASILPKARFAFRLVHQIDPSPGGKLRPFIRYV